MSKLVTKEIIDKMISRYPIGTKIKCLHNWTNYPDETGIITSYETLNSTLYKQNGKGALYVRGSIYWLVVWNNGEWAEVIKYPDDYKHLSEIDDIRKWLEDE